MDSKRAAEVLRVMMLDGENYREDCQETEAGAQALEAWVWVERHVDDIVIQGDRSTGSGWVWVIYNDGNRAEGATVYAAVLDAMEKEKR